MEFLQKVACVISLFSKSLISFETTKMYFRIHYFITSWGKIVKGEVISLPTSNSF